MSAAAQHGVEKDISQTRKEGDTVMALKKERLLEIAYRLLEEPGWFDRRGKKAGMTAINTVAGIFAEFARYPETGERMKKTLAMVEALTISPLARHGMKEQYQTIIDVLKIKKGEVQHPDLKGLSFEELAYVLGWLSRLLRARSAGITVGVVQAGEKSDKPNGEASKKEEEIPMIENLESLKKKLKDWADKQKV